VIGTCKNGAAVFTKLPLSVHHTNMDLGGLRGREEAITVRIIPPLVLTLSSHVLH
jgi:hypothetical protein